MGENQRKPSSRLGGLRGGGGGDKIVEVHGGRIVRSTGRKDRHSKVCTAKGPRDRRVRLSANTAIQFYDVQDRLGYDRPSKAVDWLINKAKIYIDKLDELPPWNPLEQNHNTKEDGDGDFGQLMESANDGSGFLPPSLDSDAIADTIKSFFPTSTPSSMSMQFQGYPPPPAPLDLLSRSTSSQSQDLNLSLQSFADPFLLPHHRHQTNHQNQQPFFSVAAAAASLGFDASAAAPWSYHQSSDMNKFPKMVGWNTAGVDAASAATISSGGGGGGFSFKSPPPVPQPMLVQSGQLCFQRGPLQSSYAPPIRAWLDPSTVSSGAATAAVAEHQYHQMPPGNPMSLISSTGFSSGRNSGFQIPARIRGEEEHDDGAPNKPSSVSSNSRH